MIDPVLSSDGIHGEIPGTGPGMYNIGSLTERVQATTGVGCIVLSGFLAMRLYVRLHLQKSWLVDDWFSLLAFAITIGAFIVMYKGSLCYVGDFISGLSNDQAAEASSWTNTGSIMYGIAMGFNRVALLYLYCRVIKPKRTSDLAKVFWCLTVTMYAFYGTTSVVQTIRCFPVERREDPNIPGSCINPLTLLLVTGVFNTISALLIFSLPVFIVVKRRMNVENCVSSALLVIFGLASPIVSGGALFVAYRLRESPDITFAEGEIFIWTASELIITNICTSLPDASPLCLFKPVYQIGVEIRDLDDEEFELLEELNKKENTSRGHYAAAPPPLPEDDEIEPIDV